MPISISILNADALKGADKALVKNADDALQKTAMKVAGKLKDAPPIKTGRLRRSQTVDKILAGEYDIKWMTPYAMNAYQRSTRPFWDKGITDNEVANIFSGIFEPKL